MVQANLQFSFEQFMVVLEIIRMLNKKHETLEVDATSLSLDVIRQAGPGGGEFLTSPHTLKHCRTLLFQPELSPPRRNGPEDLPGSVCAFGGCIKTGISVSLVSGAEMCTVRAWVWGLSFWMRPIRVSPGM